MWDQNKEKLGVTGHRGCKAYMPENTLISFREAFKLGVDVLEFDIQLTRDDVMIVMHDEMVDRTTDGTGAVWFKTLEEMKALDAGVKFGFPGERVPTFEEALKCIKNEAKHDRPSHPHQLFRRHLLPCRADRRGRANGPCRHRAVRSQHRERLG